MREKIGNRPSKTKFFSKQGIVSKNFGINNVEDNSGKIDLAVQFPKKNRLPASMISLIV